MENQLIELLESFEVPVRRQGSLADDEKYPDTFITFWNHDSDDIKHYDNLEYGTLWKYNIFVYSNNPAIPYSLLEDIRRLLKAHDWIISGHGFDAASDEATHTGRGITAVYVDYTVTD